MKKQKKIADVKILSEKLSKAKSIVLADYRGLTHKQLETLRKALKKVNGEFIIAKNTLLKIALKESDDFKNHLPGLEGQLQNPTATLFSYEDAVSPLAEIAKFIKTLHLPQIKIGVVQNELLSKEKILELSRLPPREILIGKIIGALNLPLYGLHNALSWNLRKLTVILNQIATKKQSLSS